MGATVSVGKKVAAFVSASGITHYVLFENIYEKNCYPHVPDWCAVFVGTQEETVKEIFRFASHCCGGMLQGPKGTISPEGYAAGWLEQMAVPLTMPDVRKALQVQDGFYATVPRKKANAAIGMLRGEGTFRHDLADVLERGEKAEVSLYQDTEVFLALQRAGIGLWRLIGEGDCGTLYASNLAYKADPVNAPELPALDAYRLDDAFLVRQADGKFRVRGNSSDMEEKFVSHYGALEYQYPGNFRKAIRNFRRSLAAMPVLPRVAVLEIDPVKAVTEWEKRATADLMERLGTRIGLQELLARFEQDQDLRWQILRGRNNALAWTLPAHEPQRARQQIDLFAA